MAFQRPFLISLKRGDSGERWGFGIKGGKDYGEPLLIQTVNEDSLAEHCGLRAGDEVIQVGRVNVQDLTLGQVYELLARCGNKIEMFVIREDLFSPRKGKEPPVVKAVVHNPYNSPLSLYSTENVAETLAKQTEVLTEGHVSTEEDEGPENLSFKQKSAVFQLLEEQSRQEGGTKSASRGAYQSAPVSKPKAAPPPPPPKPPSSVISNGYDTSAVYPYQEQSRSRVEYQTTSTQKVHNQYQYQQEQPVQYQQTTVYQSRSPGYQSPVIDKQYTSSHQYPAEYQQSYQQSVYQQSQGYQSPTVRHQDVHPGYQSPSTPTYKQLNQVNYQQSQQSRYQTQQSTNQSYQQSQPDRQQQQLYNQQLSRQQSTQQASGQQQSQQVNKQTYQQQNQQVRPQTQQQAQQINRQAEQLSRQQQAEQLSRQQQAEQLRRQQQAEQLRRQQQAEQFSRQQQEEQLRRQQQAEQLSRQQQAEQLRRQQQAQQQKSQQSQQTAVSKAELKIKPAPPPRGKPVRPDSEDMAAVYKQQYENHLHQHQLQQDMHLNDNYDEETPRVHLIEGEILEHNSSLGAPITYKAPPVAPPKPHWPPLSSSDYYQNPEPISPTGMDISSVWPPRKSAATDLPRTGFNPAAVREQGSGRRCVWPPPVNDQNGRFTPQSPPTGRRVHFNPSPSPPTHRRTVFGNAHSPSRRKDLQWPPPESESFTNGRDGYSRPSPRMSRKAEFDDYVHQHASINVPQTYRPPPGTQHVEYR